MNQPLNHVNHVGASVRKLDRPIEFYQNLTGGELEFVSEMYGPGLARVTGDEGVRVRFCLIKLGNTVLELIRVAATTGGRQHTSRGRCWLDSYCL